MHQPPNPRLAAGLPAFLVAASLAISPSLARGEGPVPAEWRAAAGLGLSIGMGDEKYSAAAVRVDAERTLRVLSPRARLAVVFSLGMTHPADAATVPIGLDPITGTMRTAEITWDANVFELVPAARVAYAASPTVAFYADGGLGLAYTATRVGVPPEAEALGISGGPDEGAAAVLRLGGGLSWTPSANVRIGLELVGVHARFGGGVGSSFDFLASVSHSL
ncbi:MAG TPA: hypothetical protein VFL83_17620 [Anaeromyxobacter sp.]|nr:hypothetical protein [Anaeromyxobacter sp.]